MDFNLLSSADLQGFPFSSFNKNRVSLDLTFLLSQSVVTAFTNVAVALKPFRFWDTVFWLVTFVFRNGELLILTTYIDKFMCSLQDKIVLKKIYWN